MIYLALGHINFKIIIWIWTHNIPFYSTRVFPQGTKLSTKNKSEIKHGTCQVIQNLVRKENTHTAHGKGGPMGYLL